MEKTFTITGMSCAGCQQNVQNTVSKIPGVQEVNVNLVSSTMRVICDTTLSSATIINSITEIGYGAVEQFAITNFQPNTLKKQLTNVLVSLALLLPLMLIAMATMHAANNLILIAAIQFTLTTIILVFNRYFFIRGFKSLIKLLPNMDTLVALGSGAAYLYGIVSIFLLIFGQTTTLTLYFEGSATIVTLVSLGKYFEDRAKFHTSHEIDKLLQLTPQTCTVVKNGERQTIAVSAVNCGDIIIIRPGDVIPVDGEIVEGNGSINQAAITGESLPVTKVVGDQVMAATNNENGTFAFRATKVGRDTTVSQIVNLVEQASNSKAPIARIADRVSGIFVPIVLALSLVALITWLAITQNFAMAFNFSISVLVISCPCALGLATPLAIMIGTGKAAKYGILIKDATHLENLAKIDTIVLDKTGTITTGKLTITDIMPLQDNVTAKSLLQICASVERHSNHPLAKAIVAQYQSQNEFLPITKFQEQPGHGVSANMGSKAIWIGNEKFVSPYLHKPDKLKITAAIAEFTAAGKTTVICATTDKVLGVIALSDTLRTDSVNAIKQLQKMGLQIIMLTGDNETTATAFAKSVGITNVVANVLPEQKYQLIEQLKKQGHHVLMVGDGINDAPALKAAAIGAAIGSGTNIAVETANLVLINNSLGDLVTAIRLSRRTINNIKLSLFWAFFYNILGIPLAAGLGYPLGLTLNPMLSSLAMSASSLCVVGNALTLNWFQPKDL